MTDTPVPNPGPIELQHAGPTEDAPVLDYAEHYRRAEQWLVTAEAEHAAGRWSGAASASRLASAHATIASTAPPMRYITGDGGTTGRFGAHGEQYRPGPVLPFDGLSIHDGVSASDRMARDDWQAHQ